LEEYGDHPVPLDEVELWMMRRAKLTSVIRQIHSPLAVEILRTITEASSPYSNSIRTVINEVYKVGELYVQFSFYRRNLFAYGRSNHFLC